MYTSVDISSGIVARRGVPRLTNKEVSYTNLARRSDEQGGLIDQFGVWLGRDLKNRLLLLLLYKNKWSIYYWIKGFSTTCFHIVESMSQTISFMLPLLKFVGHISFGKKFFVCYFIYLVLLTQPPYLYQFFINEFIHE